jgi:aerobic carbon-monoxide dehydrogenase large subunit
MIVAEKLGISPDDVDVLHSDTAIAPIGLDSYGSRSLAVGGVAIAMACDKVIDKAKLIAAHQLEASADDLEFAGGAFSVTGSPDKTMPLAAIAFEAFTAHNLPDGLEPNLEANMTYDPPNFSWPFGTHMCVVEVDTETGGVDVLKYVAVDDCGVQVNPLIVDGQVHGGVIQGLAQALFEEAVYDTDGNLKTSTMAEYLVPAASDVPPLTLGHTVTPSPTNQLGVKGIGEAGTIGAAPAVINAVVDALSGLGVRDVPMPASPLNVFNALHGAARAPSDTAGTDLGDHPGVTARTTVSEENGAAE